MSPLEPQGASTMTDAERIGRLEARVEQLEKLLRAVGAVFSGGGAGGGPGSEASDRELDGQYGDPEVKAIPRDWTAGGVSKGQKYSRCPADFLDVLAETLEYFAQKNEAANAMTTSGKPKAGYDRRNARLARGWARRIRAGWTPPEPAKPAFGSGGGFGGASPGFGQSGSGFGRSGGGFGAPAAPPEPANGTQYDEDGFPFGANVPPAPPSPLPPIDDPDDDPPI